MPLCALRIASRATASAHAAAAMAAVASSAPMKSTSKNHNNHSHHNVKSAASVAAVSASASTRPRPQPIAGTPPPDPNEKCDAKTIQQTCTLFGLDLVGIGLEPNVAGVRCKQLNHPTTIQQERPPPVPPSRPYTVTGNSKLGYPQSRVMKMNFPEDSATNLAPEQLQKGKTVTVVGASHRRGHLIVEKNGISFHVPFQFMELVKSGVGGGGGGQLTASSVANAVAAATASAAISKTVKMI